MSIESVHSVLSVSGNSSWSIFIYILQQTISLLYLRGTERFELEVYGWKSVLLDVSQS